LFFRVPFPQRSEVRGQSASLHRDSLVKERPAREAGNEKPPLPRAFIISVLIILFQS
jgi:hypothetical protein